MKSWCFSSLFLCFLVAAVTGELSPYAFRDVSDVKMLSRTQSDCGDALSCWLDELSFQIPDTCFDVMHVECCITDFVCSGLSLENIASMYKYPTSLYMSFDDLALSCKGDWKYGLLGGEVSADMSKIVVSTTAEFPKEGIYATSLTFPTCEIPSIKIDLSFSGGLAGAVLDLISGAVESGLEKAVYTVVCDKVENGIADKVTNALVTTINPSIEEIVASKPSLPPNSSSLSGGKYLDYTTSLPGLLAVLEEELGDDYLNKLVDILTGGTGIVKVDLGNQTVEKEIVDPTSGPLANISLVFHSMQVEGLNSFHDIYVLTPSPENSTVYSPYSIFSSFSMGSLKLVVDMSVVVELDQAAVSGTSLVEHFAVSMDLSNITLGLEMFLPLNLDSIGELYLDQLTDFDCLIGSLDYFTVSSLVADMLINEVSITPLGPDIDPDSLESDIDKLINDAIKVGISGFPELVTGTISGLAQGRVRESLNNQLDLILSDAKNSCRPHEENPPDADPAYMEWVDAPLLSFFDTIVNDVVGYEGVNRIMEQLTNKTGSVSVELDSFFMNIFNLNSFYEFALLSPSRTNHFVLDNKAALGFCRGHSEGGPRNPEPTCTPLGLSFESIDVDFFVDADQNEHWGSRMFDYFLSGHFDKEVHSLPKRDAASFLFSNASSFLSVEALLDVNKVKNLRVNQFPLFLGNVSARNGCLLRPFDSIQVEDFNLSVAEATVSKGPLSKDIVTEVQSLLDVLSSDIVVKVMNKLVESVQDAAETACETGEWPNPINEDDDENNDDDWNPECDSPLSCFFNQLMLGPVPSDGDSVCLEVSGVSFCISNIECNNIDLQGFPTSLVNKRTMSFGIDDLDITCSADYSLGTSHVENLYAGSANIKLGEFGASFDVELGETSASSDYPPYPDSLKISECSIPSGYSVKVIFEGGFIAEMLNEAVSPQLESFLVEYLDWLFCYVFAPPVSRILSKVIQEEIDPLLMKVMDIGSEPVVPVQIPGMFAWNTSVLETIYDLFDAFKESDDTDEFGGILGCLMETVNAPSTSLLNSLLQPKDLSNDLNPKKQDIPSYFGAMSFDISETVSLPFSNGIAGSLIFETLSITGLRTLHDISLLRPSDASSVTLITGASLDSFEIQLKMKVLLNDTSDEMGFGYYEQEVVLDISASDVFLEMDLVLAMEKSALGDLYIDQVFDIACLFSSVYEFELSSLILDMKAENVEIKQMHNGDADVLEEDAVDLIDNAIAVFVKGYPEMVTSLLTGLFQGSVKDGINANLREKVEDWKALHPCTPHTDHHANTSDPYPMEWAENPIIATLDSILNEMIGPSGVNTFMSCVTNNTGEIFVDIPPSSPLLAGWSIGLQGLQSFYKFALLYPVDGANYDLGNTLGLGYCSAPSNASDYNPIIDPQNSDESCSPFALTISGDEPDGRHVDIAISMENLMLYLDMLLKVNMKAVADLRVSQLSQEGCLLSTLTEMGINEFILNTSDVEFYFLNGDGQVDMTDTIVSLLESITSPASIASINSKMSDALTVAAEKCAGTYEPLDGGGDSSASSDGEGFSSWKWKLGLVLGGCFVAVAVLIWIYNHYGTTSKYKRNSASGESFEYDDNGDAVSVSNCESSACFSNEWITLKLAELFGWTEGDFYFDALIGQEKIPAYVRVLMPIALLGNIALFLNSNLATGASVMVEIDIGSAVVKPDPIFEFGLANTVRDMWNAGVYPLSILVAFFSGAWPYIKLFVMLLCWVFPTSVLPKKHRDSALVWLDILGKWSLLDTYVMVLMMVAFNFDLIVAPGIEVIVYVVPNWGFYGFLLATMMSLGLGHLVLACHRLVTEPKVPADDFEAEAAMNHTFDVDVSFKSVVLSSFSTDETMSSEGHRVEQRTWKKCAVQFTTFGKMLVVFILSASILAVIVGTFKNTFQFEFKGLTGYLMDPSDRVEPYGLVSVGNILPSASGSPKDFGIRWIQASYFAFGLAMPLAFLVALLLLWITPLTLRIQKFWLVTTEVLNAWNALDVFVVSIVAALLEIQQFASFIVGDSCDVINEVLKEEMHDELEGDDKCFDVVATLKESAVYLYLSAVLLIIVGLCMLRLFHAAVTERVKVYQSKQLFGEFSCLSDDGVRGSFDALSQSTHTSMSARSTLRTQNFSTGFGGSCQQPLLPSGTGEETAQDESRDRVDTVDLTPDEAPEASVTSHDQDIERAAEILTSKSSGGKSRQPTVEEALGLPSKEDASRGYVAKSISCGVKVFEFLRVVTISRGDEE